MTRFWKGVVVVLGVCLVAAAPEGRAQSAGEAAGSHRDSVAVAESDPEARDSTRHPNQVPYESSRSFVGHVLAVPSYVLHGVTRPIGWLAAWGMENLLPIYQKYFLGPRGIFPVLTLGGETAAEGGFVAFDNQLFGSTHGARLRAVWGSRRTNEFQFTYEIPEVVGPGSQLSFSTRYFNDPSREFFRRGNEANQDADETRFDLEQFQVSARLDYELSSSLSGHTTVEFEDASTSRSDSDEELGRRLPLTTPGLGDSERLQIQTGFDVDATSPGPRATSGTRLELGLRYDHELGDDRFRYGGYAVEVQQFVPVQILPETRRLALRARLQQSESLGGDSSIPFYELSKLGGSGDLRGFETNRFSDEGFLLLSAEYRYPIWDNMDALFFTDVGQVFDALQDVPGNRFHGGGGMGIHLLGNEGPRFRLEVAASRETVRVILTAGPAF